MGWSWQNSPRNSFEKTSRCWNGSTRWKIFPWKRNSLSLFELQHRSSKTKNRQTIKIKTVSRKLFWNRCNFGLSREVMNATFCHSSCHQYAALWWTLLSLDQSGVAVPGATNSVNARQSEAVTVSLFFPPSHPTLLTPPPLPKGISLVSRDQDDGPVKLNDQHLRSHGKIGDCEQSTTSFLFTYFSHLFD